MPDRSKLDVHCVDVVPYISTLQSALKNGMISMPMVEDKRADTDAGSSTPCVPEADGDEEWVRFHTLRSRRR